MHSSIVFEAIIELNRSGDMSCALTQQHTHALTNMYALFAFYLISQYRGWDMRRSFGAARTDSI
jgi:hypothetical protein